MPPPDWTPVAHCQAGTVKKPCYDPAHTVVTISGVDLMVCERHCVALERDLP